MPNQAHQAVPRRRPAPGAGTAAAGAACARLLLGVGLGLPATSLAQEAAAGQAAPERPRILFNRWQEDWSALADPRVARQPLDGLKYIPLAASDPKAYLSLGADLRERFESNDAPLFGTGGNRRQDYLISRAEVHADLHAGPHVQAFVQLQSDFAPWKTQPTPADKDRLDLEQAFVALAEPLGQGTWKLRLGRQQFAFDMQRFVSVRDGPNVRQSYDAAWTDYEQDAWRFIAFYSHPVQNRDERAFDDDSSGKLSLGGGRVEWQPTASTSLAAYYARYSRDDARYADAAGDERRNILDVHATGSGGGFDWDVEAMRQTGRFAAQDVRAWAWGSLGGYTFADLAWSPRIGLQVDAASGDRDPRDRTLGTFNPLFPNGAYVSLSGYSGYTNFIQAKPSLTLHPSPALKLMVAVAPQWRQTTADAVYAQPNLAVPGTAGHGGRFTGTYEQLRVDWAASRALAFALEAVHFDVADAIRAVGGHDGNYLGAQVSLGW